MTNIRGSSQKQNFKYYKDISTINMWIFGRDDSENGFQEQKHLPPPIVRAIATVWL